MDFGIVDPAVERYLHEIAPESEPILAEMERLGAERDFPLVGPLVGRLLFVLARTQAAASIFELGSGFGYSGLWFAKALDGHGRVILTERDPANVAAAKDFFSRAGLYDRAVFELGDGLEVFERYPGPFDIVFCDLDKKSYPQVFEMALPKLRRGGLLVADNVLWSGRVAGDDDDESTVAIREFNRLIMGCRDLAATILPLRDGVAIAAKL